MSATSATPFLTVLKSMYGENLEYQNPYKGTKGSYTAEIYNGKGIPSVMLDKLSFLSLKMINDNEINNSSDFDVIKSACGCRGGIVQLIFAKTSAFQIFESTLVQDYQDCMQKEKTDFLRLRMSSCLAEKYNIYKNEGPITSQQLRSKIPALKNLITGSQVSSSIGNEGSLEFLAKSRKDLEEAAKIIQAVFKENNYSKNYENLMKFEEKLGLEVLQLSTTALTDLKALLETL